MNKETRNKQKGRKILNDNVRKKERKKERKGTGMKNGERGIGSEGSNSRLSTLLWSSD
jgi:hypothetical protein